MCVCVWGGDYYVYICMGGKDKHMMFHRRHMGEFWSHSVMFSEHGSITQQAINALIAIKLWGLRGY